MKAVYLTGNGSQAIREAYSAGDRAILAKRLAIPEGTVETREELENREDLREAEAVFSTWGMPALSEEELERLLPRLRAVFYAAGSVQAFARPFLRRGVRIFCAAQANAVPVAQYTVAQILLANKGFFSAAPLYHKGRHGEARAAAQSFPGNFGSRVGILGAGAIGRMVVRELVRQGLSPLVFDPFFPREEAADLGVELADLETVFASCHVVSNHLADNPETRGMLDYRLFSLLPPNGVFLNTGRGAQVVEGDLARAMAECPGRCALLDVTHPEPVEAGHPFFHLDNVILTPHIAGSMSGEIARMGSYMVEAHRAFAAGEPSPYEVTEDMLATMA